MGDARVRWALPVPGLACFALATFLAMRMPVFFGADERSHFAYVVAVIEGDLPELTDRQPLDPRFPVVEQSLGDRSAPPHSGVANHPPLTYLVAAAPVRLAALIGDEAPAVAMRLVNGVGMAIGVVGTGLVAAEVWARRRGLVALGAAGLAAVTPNVVGVAGYGHNDGVAFALAAGVLWSAARLLRAGPSRRTLGAAMVLAPAAILTRASLAPAVALLVVAAAVAVWRRRDRSGGAGTRAGLVRAGGIAAAVAGVAVAAAGWFYLRNRALYGSPTADDFLLERYGRESKGSLLDVLTDADYFRAMTYGMYGEVHPSLMIDQASWVVTALGLVLLAGALAALGRWVWSRRASTPARPSPVAANGSGATPEAGLGLLGWLLIAGYCGAAVVATARFYSEGGSAHPRYFLPVVPVVSALLARALAELPAARAILAAAVAGLAAVTWSQIARYPELIDSPDHHHPFDTAPGSGVVQGLALVVAVVAGVAYLAILVADRRRSRRGTVDSGPGGDHVASGRALTAPV